MGLAGCLRGRLGGPPCRVGAAARCAATRSAPLPDPAALRAALSALPRPPAQLHALCRQPAEPLWEPRRGHQDLEASSGGRRLRAGLRAALRWFALGGFRPHQRAGAWGGGAFGGAWPA